MHAIVPVASWARVWSTGRATSVPGTSSPRTRCSSRIVRASEAMPRSVSQERADPLGGVERFARPHGPDPAAVGKRLVDREVQPLLALLHLRAVERALARRGGD